MADIERALSTLVATTGNYLVPEVVDPAIRDWVQKATPILNVVTRVPWPTQTYYIRKRTALPTATWDADEAALPAASRSSYMKSSQSVKFLYTKGSVTGPLIAASGGVVNALQAEIQASSQAIAEKLATDIIAADGSPAEEIVGMLSQISSGAFGDEGGTYDASTGALTLKMLDYLIDGTRGEADVLLTSRKTRRAINSLLQSQQRFNDSVEIGGGFRVLTYDGIPIVTDLHWETDGKIIAFRKSDAKLIVNQDFTFVPLAKTADSEDYFIKGYFGFALEGRPGLLTNFTYPAGVL